MTNTPRTPGTPSTGRTGLTRRTALLVAPILGLGLVACGDDDADPPPPVATDPATDPGVTDSVADPGDDMSAGFDETSIIGLPVDDARDDVEADGREFRVARLDGEDQALTADLVEGRVNVVVVDGVVESVAFYG